MRLAEGGKKETQGIEKGLPPPRPLYAARTTNKKKGNSKRFEAKSKEKMTFDTDNGRKRAQQK